MGRKVFHVIPDENGWKIQLENETEPFILGRTKLVVLKKAEEFAKQEKESKVVIFNKDGSIEEERTYQE